MRNLFAILVLLLALPAMGAETISRSALEHILDNQHAYGNDEYFERENWFCYPKTASNPKPKCIRLEIAKVTPTDREFVKNADDSVLDNTTAKFGPLSEGATITLQNLGGDTTVAVKDGETWYWRGKWVTKQKGDAASIGIDELEDLLDCLNHPTVRYHFLGGSYDSVLNNNNHIYNPGPYCPLGVDSN